MRKHIFISGRVQGVGFRHFTRKNAEALSVKGWVKNLPDGRVEAVFEGSDENVRKLIDKCRKGPVSSKVEQLNVNDFEGQESFTSFRVRY